MMSLLLALEALAIFRVNIIVMQIKFYFYFWFSVPGGREANA
jgi:hypothetical protein